MKNIIIVYLITFFILHSSNINSQPYDYSCGTEINPGVTTTSSGFIGGKYKPHRSDIGGAPTGADYFPVLVVFVQFQNEPGDTTNMDVNYWRPGFAPNFVNQTIRTSRNDLTSWWDSYNGYDFSDFWHEFSRGKFHIIGRAVSVILPHDYQWYVDYTGGNIVGKINKDTYDALNDESISVFWPDYDKWTYNDTGDFSFATDGRVDMLMKVHRHDPNRLLHPTAAGHIPLGECEGANNENEYTVYQNGSTTININGNAGGNGSGGVVCPKDGITDREFFLAVTTHEMGHYMWGEGHHVYCKMVAGAGGEFSLSPWEMIKMGYIEQRIVNYSNHSFSLYDYSSRGGTAGTEGEILQVPIDQNGSEFFLIASRRKISDWDRRMGGDTVPEKFLRNINPEYGKGLYIYHINDGFNEPLGNDKDMDLECADGLWTWIQDGTASPIWNQGVIHPAFKKTSAGYVHDDPAAFDNISKDGMSAQVTGIVNGNPITMGIWYSKGRSHLFNPLTNGTDRIFSNDNNSWYSLAFSGDRYDAWNVGYNEIFSPYSSPNTNTWVNGNSGIFIWYYNYTGDSPPNLAYMKIYKAGSGGFSEDSILHLTPPSRPMNIVVDYYLETEDIMRPIITWNHNMEPDMLSDSLTKRYLIWRATASSMASVPADYILLKTMDIDSGTAPVYIDTSIIAFGSVYPGTGEQMQYPVRYTVQAIDKYQDSSVRSDFGSATGIINCGNACAYGEDNNLQNEQTPKKYSLNQNYPNPFNPATKIKYDLANDNFVTIKIYDMLGKELLSLVNEFKQTGSYTVTFDAADYPSGVYYYKIKTGSFTQVRKMILIR